ncbi:carbon-nitrogen hydrolase family protein [Brachybacterium sacelli]|uniref:Amidohydrolase n=1 Tax=Brachybacterium sacelli TaxID=173364 RepID=A0ABS4WYK4_9MICO|nr:carbon-nitrogen hydrolase family protein [Brachybacterium sacelli]MBP2381211.1 putative amidohydrolase [Brachybacterium sacelli]
MTAHRALKKRVRARMARTGESYTAALRHLRSVPGGTVPTQNTTSPAVRIATAQTTPHHDPADPDGFRRAGREIRDLMHRARDQGADLIQFPEATFCFPDKWALSRSRDELTEADWQLFAWDALDAELHQVRQTARQLSLWTVVGAQTRAPQTGTVQERRPRTSLLVIDPQGRIHAQYDERRLSRSKATYLYERGHEQVTLEVGGIRLGLASGLEVLFGDIFLAYEDAGADAVLFSSQGPGEPEEADSLSTSARAAASQHGLVVGYSVPTTNAPHVPSGVIGANGRWAAQCPEQESPALVVVEVPKRLDGGPREWRRSMVDAG